MVRLFDSTVNMVYLLVPCARILIIRGDTYSASTYATTQVLLSFVSNGVYFA